MAEPSLSERNTGQEEVIRMRLGRIRHKILVLSGKGGVGKSTVAVNLAASLALAGHRTGLLDVDIHGPSMPTMLGIEGRRAEAIDGVIVPVEAAGMKVISLGFFTDSIDDAVIWRGPLKAGLIRQFLSDVEWGDLDYLVVDSPPGTGDEPLSVCQLMGPVDGAVVVTTPQRVAAVDVRKCISFCRKLGVQVLGVIENMSGFACPKCGEVTHVLMSGGGAEMARDMDVPFLGAVPLDPLVAESCDSGRPFVYHYSKTPTARIMSEILGGITESRSGHSGVKPENPEGRSSMKVAVPVSGGRLCAHFGHCDSFAVLEVDRAKGEVLSRADLQAPPHEPGLLPRWLAREGVQLIIAGGMGSRARGLFSEGGIEVITGALPETPEEIVKSYLAGTLVTGENVCDH